MGKTECYHIIECDARPESKLKNIQPTVGTMRLVCVIFGECGAMLLVVFRLRRHVRMLPATYHWA